MLLCACGEPSGGGGEPSSEGTSSEDGEIDGVQMMGAGDIDITANNFDLTSGELTNARLAHPRRA